jgi:hypothetical protein
MNHVKELSPYNARCFTEKEPHICVHAFSVEQSRQGKAAESAYQNMVGDPHVQLGSVAQKDYLTKRSHLAVKLLTGAGPLPGSLRSMFPAEGFTGISYVDIDPSCWEAWTGQDLKDDVPSWWPNASEASGRLIALSACEPK